jgi:hypothetical protein
MAVRAATATGIAGVDKIIFVKEARDSGPLF